MDLLERIHHYEPALIAMIVGMMPENPDAWHQVYGFKTYDEFFHQVVFALHVYGEGSTSQATLFLDEAFRGPGDKNWRQQLHRIRQLSSPLPSTYKHFFTRPFPS